MFAATTLKASESARVPQASGINTRWSPIRRVGPSLQLFRVVSVNGAIRFGVWRMTVTESRSGNGPSAKARASVFCAAGVSAQVLRSSERASDNDRKVPNESARGSGPSSSPAVKVRNAADESAQLFALSANDTETATVAAI